MAGPIIKTRTFDIFGPPRQIIVPIGNEFSAQPFWQKPPKRYARVRFNRKPFCRRLDPIPWGEPRFLRGKRLLLLRVADVLLR